MKGLVIGLLCLFSTFAFSQTITTIAGTGSSSYSGNGVPATSAGLPNPGGGAFDRFGNYYFADGQSSHRIRKIDPSGIITTVAGNGTAGYNGDNIAATAANLYTPQAVIFDKAGNFYICEKDDSRIRKVTISTGVITTIVGVGTHGFSGDGGQATAAKLQGPNDICFDKWGNLYIADLSNHRVRKVDTFGIITTFAGPGTTAIGDGGPATDAQINAPTGLASDDSGNVYIADESTCRIRKVNASGIITTVAGNGSYIYAGDGISATSANIAPIKIAFDHFRNLVIADRYNKRVFSVDTTGTLTCIAGNGTSTFSGDGSPATSAGLVYPTGISFDECNNLFLPTGGKNIRKVTYPSTPSITIFSPAIATIGSSVTVTSTLAGTGGNYSIKWYNRGILFATTTTPTVTYTKAQCTDSITAVVYGCSDSATSNLKVVKCGTDVGSLQSVVGSCTVYPNPVGDELNIEASELIESVVISNILGETVLTSRTTTGKNERHIKLPLGQLPRGIYLVKVACPDVFGGRVYVERVIKE